MTNINNASVSTNSNGSSSATNDATNNSTNSNGSSSATNGATNNSTNSSGSSSAINDATNNSTNSSGSSSATNDATNNSTNSSGSSSATNDATNKTSGNISSSNTSAATTNITCDSSSKTNADRSDSTSFKNEKKIEDEEEKKGISLQCGLGCDDDDDDEYCEDEVGNSSAFIDSCDTHHVTKDVIALPEYLLPSCPCPGQYIITKKSEDKNYLYMIIPYYKQMNFVKIGSTTKDPFRLFARYSASYGGHFALLAFPFVSITKTKNTLTSSEHRGYCKHIGLEVDFSQSSDECYNDDSDGNCVSSNSSNTNNPAVVDIEKLVLEQVFFFLVFLFSSCLSFLIIFNSFLYFLISMF